MFQSGLLILTSPVTTLLSSVPKILSTAASHVQKVLYIHLAPDVLKTKEPIPVHVVSTRALRHLVTDLYTFAANHYHTLDLRVIVGNVGSCPAHPRPALHKYRLHYPYEILLVSAGNGSLLEYAKRNFTPASADVTMKVISVEGSDSASDEGLESFDGVVLGGTFDRLHAGHKILLNDALIRCEKKLVIGVTDGPMNDKKLLPELIEPCQTRISAVLEFLEDVKPQLLYHVVPILDPYGPSIVDPDLQCIVVSQETLKGGESVNKKRIEKGLNRLTVVSIDLVHDDHHELGEEDKISSSSLRRRLLGTLLKPSKRNPDLSPSPYIIGLTGGIASGKSSVCKRLQGLGAAVVDCDKLGHVAYEKDGAAYDKVVQAFGVDILDADRRINRKTLGSKIFSDPDARQHLNMIVWPVIKDLARQEIAKFHKTGSSVVILDAAVLLEAGWDDMVHEVWTTVIPIEEAVKRIKERNNLNEEEARKRIFSQMNNHERVERANVVLCTLWEYSVTQKQVEKAWRLLQDRISLDQSHL